MADDELDDEDEDARGVGEDDGDDNGDGEDLESSDSGGNKKLFIIVGAVILLVIGGIGGAYVAGLLDPIIEAIAGGEPGEGDDSAAAGTVFYDLPELLVNLNTGGRKSTFLKIRVALELQKQEDIPKVEEMMPRIIDNFQVYLRELRIEDLKGSAGMYRLREELLTRVAAAAAPAQVNDVLFKEMLVQ